MNFRCALGVVAIVLTIGSLTLAGGDAPQSLDRQAKEIATKQIGEMGQSYHAAIDNTNHLVYVTALDQEHLKRLAAMLAVYTQAQRKTLLAASPTWNVTIVLPTAQDYKRLAPREDVTGFYEYDARRILSLDRGPVLLHEFTHALEHADSGEQVHAVWVQEGIATLYESAVMDDNGLWPQVDGRVILLQRAIRKKTVLPLEDFLKLDSEGFVKQAEICYAQARGVMLYMHQKGKLKAFYQAYKDGFKDDPTGKEAMEKTFGEKIYTIETDWLKWAAALKVDPAMTKAAKARIGLEVATVSDGVKVVSLVKGGPAQTSGRINAGDVITKVNGHAISNPVDFMAFVRSAGAGTTVTIELMRDGHKIEVQQPLDAK